MTHARSQKVWPDEQGHFHVVSQTVWLTPLNVCPELPIITWQGLFSGFVVFWGGLARYHRMLEAIDMPKTRNNASYAPG